MNNNHNKFVKTMIAAGLSFALTACGDSESEIIADIDNAINSAAVISSSGANSVEVGSAYSYALVSTDVDGDALTLSATTLPTWLSFDSTTGKLSGTPTESDIGEHAITLTVSDGTDDTVQAFTISVTATVVQENSAPEITSTEITSAIVGESYTYTLLATDVDNDSLVMSATIPDTMTWLTFDATTGVLSGTPASGDVASTEITLTVNDGTDDVTQVFTISVTAAVVDPVNHAPVVTSTEIANATVGAEYSYTLIATDADNDTLTMAASIPSELSWLIFDTTTGILSGTPVFSDIGANEISLTVNDGTADTTQVFTITVADVVVDSGAALVVYEDEANPLWAAWADDITIPVIITDDDANHDQVTQFIINNGTAGAVMGFNARDAVNGVAFATPAGTTLEFDLKVTTMPDTVDTDWKLKLEDSASGAKEVNLQDSAEGHVPVLDTWMHYTFDVPALGLPDVDLIMIFPAWGTGNGAVFSVDNVKFYVDADAAAAAAALALLRAPGDSGDDETTTVAAGIDFEGPQLTWSSFDTAKVEYVANPATTGINTSATTALFDIIQGDGEWVGALTQGIDNFALDATNCTVKVDVYKDTISEVHVKFQKNNGVDANGIMWGSKGSVGVANTVVNQWETLTFDTCHWVGDVETDNIGALAIFPDKTGGRSQNTKNYIDNIMFSAQVVSVDPTAPTDAAPVPTALDADVISVFSDTYTAVAGVNTNPGWGQATITTEIDVAGNNTLKMAGLNYQGIDLTNTDVSGKTSLHLDYWTADSTGFDIFLISPGPQEKSYTITTTQNGWQSVDIPLSEFSGVVNLADVFQFKFVGSGTIYFDNLYFH